MTLYNEKDKRNIIMDYYLNPRNKVAKFNDKSYKKIYLHSSSCVDEISLFFNNQKDDFKFIGNGCAIFLSSCEIFIEQILNKGFKNKNKLIDLYKKMIDKKELNNEEIIFLDKLNVFENVSNHLNRKECALIIANIFEKII